MAQPMRSVNGIVERHLSCDTIGRRQDGNHEVRLQACQALAIGVRYLVCTSFVVNATRRRSRILTSNTKLHATSSLETLMPV